MMETHGIGRILDGHKDGCACRPAVVAKRLCEDKGLNAKYLHFSFCWLLLVLTLLGVHAGWGLGGWDVCGHGMGRGWYGMEWCHGTMVEVGDGLVVGGTVVM